MPRVIRVDLEYEGTRYHGFGVQPGLVTIQGVVESALAATLGEEVRVTPAGRTDGGVHARGQVISFRTAARLPAEAVSRALNARLPDDIVARSSSDAQSSFDARRLALRRHYRYSIWNDSTPNLWLRRYTLQMPCSLDLAAMNEAGTRVVGCHDFTSFVGHAAQQPTNDPPRTIERAEWIEDGNLLHFDCCADAFGRHMVRNLVGTLLWVGRGRLSPDDVSRVLSARDRRQAGPTAPARGLTLMQVDYQDQESRT